LNLRASHVPEVCWKGLEGRGEGRKLIVSFLFLSSFCGQWPKTVEARKDMKSTQDSSLMAVRNSLEINSHGAEALFVGLLRCNAVWTCGLKERTASIFSPESFSCGV
jgi:hypothetical protein